uniref:Cell division cycle protein 23 n=1 Tax=Aceria tosichella TaxID=561515 RepID=A0A6G1SPK1_9ACAR
MDLSKFSVNKIRTELWTCHILSEQRCLRKACEWAEDLLFALPEEGEEKLLAKLEKDLNNPSGDFNPRFEHAKTCFELHEYDRAAHILRDHLDDDKLRFLHYFAKYKGAEKKRFDLMNEVTINIHKKAMSKFNELRDSLERSMDRRKPDGWLLYVYGLVLYKFKLTKNSVDVLVKAINLTPNNWSAWYMLSLLIESQQQLNTVSLPNHLFKVFFYHMMRIELDIPIEEPWVLVGAKETKNFLDKYFKSSLFIKTLAAKSLGYQQLKHDDAIEVFAQIRLEDPYRQDAMEVYSNLLFVKRMRKELSKLAYEIEKVDPFTSEANSCIANSFSAREQHTKAIVYFTRALRINPDLSVSWSLLGHEYGEMKSMEKAIQAYRYSISINKRDCRAWLGLGQAIESLTHTTAGPNLGHCLYYYSQVAKYRPNNPTMFLGLGTVYERLGDKEQAIICFKRAGQEGLFKLAKLYETNDMHREAAELSSYMSVDNTFAS